MAERRRIDDDPARDFSRLMDPIDEFVFAIALMATNFQTEGAARFPARRLNVRERFMAVNLGLALAQQIEVRAVENEDQAVFRGGGHDAYFCRQGRPSAFQPAETPRWPARSGGPS